MDNFLPFSSSSNVNSFQELPMDLDNNDPLFSTIPTYDQPQPPPHLFPPYSYPMEPSVVMNSQPFHSPEVAFPQIPVMQTGSEFGPMVCNPVGLRQEMIGGSSLNNPHMTKMARINRKKAMIRSRNNSSPSSSPTDQSVETRRQVILNMKNNLQTADKKELYRYFSFDNKKLRVLLVKHLKNSDVASLGRIVLPKREAEVNLPELSDKEGIIVKMRDVDSMHSWSFKYKFWSNNKSRMYVLENTGQFVKNYGVETGDSLTLYEDESKNLYFSIRRKSADKQIELGREDESMELNWNHFEDIMFDYMPNDEDEGSFAALIGNINDNYPIQDDLMGLPVDLQHHQAESSMPPVDDVSLMPLVDDVSLMPLVDDVSLMPPVDDVIFPQHVGSSDDQVSLDDFAW